MIHEKWAKAISCLLICTPLLKISNAFKLVKTGDNEPCEHLVVNKYMLKWYLKRFPECSNSEIVCMTKLHLLHESLCGICYSEFQMLTFQCWYVQGYLPISFIVLILTNYNMVSPVIKVRMKILRIEVWVIIVII